MIRIVSVDKSGALITFRERAPGHIEFFSAQTPTQKYFDLFCLHNLFGKETGSGAADRTRNNRGEGITNLTKLAAFDPKKPTVVVGDFNLDAGNHLDSPYYKPLNSTMQCRITNQKSSYTTTKLVSEYDHIYTSKLGGKHKDDRVINIANKYFSDNFKAAAIISDHMPVIAVLSSDMFPLPQISQPLDIVTVATNTKMARIKSENLDQLKLQPNDSIFVAAVRGFMQATNDMNLDVTAKTQELKKEVWNIIYNAKSYWNIAQKVYQRIDDLYEDAFWIDPIEELKHPDEWIFETDSDEEYGHALHLARMMWDGWDLDDALEKNGVDISNSYYDILGYMVMAAYNDEANWNFQINPQVTLPGVGPLLHNEFCKPAPDYDACYAAYCQDFLNSGAIEGSYVEAQAICEFFCSPVHVFGIDDSGNLSQETYTPYYQQYSKEIKRPLYLLKDGTRYDCLFEPPKTGSV
jgi:hypothetical protein